MIVYLSQRSIFGCGCLKGFTWRQAWCGENLVDYLMSAGNATVCDDIC